MPAHSRILENVCFPFCQVYYWQLAWAIPTGIGLLVSMLLWTPLSCPIPAYILCWFCLSVSDCLPSRSSWPQRRKKKKSLFWFKCDKQWLTGLKKKLLNNKKKSLQLFPLTCLLSCLFNSFFDNCLFPPLRCFNCLGINCFGEMCFQINLLKLKCWRLWTSLCSDSEFPCFPLRLGVTLFGESSVMAAHRGTWVQEGVTSF